MSKLRCIIIEDEPLAVKVLSEYIAELTFLELQATFKDAILALEYLRSNSVELIFLDVHLPKLKGLDFLKTLLDPPAVIITTAYHRYAVEGFELDVVDYLLKPFSFDRFLRAVNKVKPNLDTDDKERDFIFVNVQKRKVKILFADMLFVESQREYVKIVTSKQVFLSKMSTQEMAALLPERDFRRIHRSFIVSLNKIESYTAESVELGGHSIPVGREYREVLELL